MIYARDGGHQQDGEALLRFGVFFFSLLGWVHPAHTSETRRGMFGICQYHRAERGRRLTLQKWHPFFFGKNKSHHCPYRLNASKTATTATTTKTASSPVVSEYTLGHPSSPAVLNHLGCVIFRGIFLLLHQFPARNFIS